MATSGKRANDSGRRRADDGWIAGETLQLRGRAAPTLTFEPAT